MSDTGSGGERGPEQTTARPVMVPVAPSATLRETIEWVVDSTLDAVEASADPDQRGEERAAAPEPEDAGDATMDDASVRPVFHFVHVHAPEEFDTDDDAPAIDDAQELLDRVTVWAEEDAGGDHRIDVRTAHVGSDRYLFSPADVAAALTDAARERDVERIVLDPEYDPGIGAPLLRPLEYELARDESLTIEEAPVKARTRRAPLVGRSTVRRIGAIAGLSFLFYQVLAGAFSPFDVVTGAVTAIVVAGALSRVSFGRDPSPTQTPVRLARVAIYMPYLFWEILISNLVVARVILDPRRSIDPRMTRIKPAVYGALPITTLANSITLTPGTLTVRVQGRELLVHTLLPGSREDLFDGSLERAVRFVFYGRRAMRLDSLRERGVAEVLPVDEEPAEGGDSS